MEVSAMDLLSRKYARAAAVVSVAMFSSRRLLPALILGAIASLTFVSQAMATPLLPDTGIDIAAMVTEVVTSLGAIVAVIVAAFFAFLLIRKALRWARSGF
jgi:hypothetical protein